VEGTESQSHFLILNQVQRVERVFLVIRGLAGVCSFLESCMFQLQSKNQSTNLLFSTQQTFLIAFSSAYIHSSRIIDRNLSHSPEQTSVNPSLVHLTCCSGRPCGNRSCFFHPRSIKPHPPSHHASPSIPNTNRSVFDIPSDPPLSTTLNADKKSWPQERPTSTGHPNHHARRFSVHPTASDAGNK
jgi:hypothetical protein